MYKKPKWNADVRIRSFLEINFFDAAVKAAKESSKNNISGNDEKNNAIISVILSWACLEAHINSFIEDTKHHHGLGDKELEKMSTQTKYSVIPRLAGCKKIEKGREPYDSFNILNSLRNNLIHFTSQQESFGDDIPLECCNGLGLVQGHPRDGGLSWLRRDFHNSTVCCLEDIHYECNDRRDRHQLA